MTEKVDYLSYSKISTFERCPKRFQHTYHEFKREEDTSFTQYGALVHETLERFEDPKIQKDEKTILDIYRELAAQESYNLVTRSMFMKGEMLLLDYLQDRLSGGKTLATEYAFKLYLDNGVPVRGVMDRVKQINEDTIQVIDYKTGFSHFPTQWEVDDDLQLSLYDLVARMEFPQFKNVELILHYFNGPRLKTVRHEYQRQALLDYLAVVYKKMMTMTTFPPRLNEYCYACSFRQECPAYKQVIVEPGTAVSEAIASVQETPKRIGVSVRDFNLPEDLPKVAAMLEFIKRKAKIIDKTKDALEEILFHHMELQAQQVIELDNYLVRLDQKKYENYQPATAQQVLGAKFFECVNVVKGRVDEYLKELQRTGRNDEADQILVALKESMSTSYSSPSVVLDKKKQIETEASPAIPAGEPAQTVSKIQAKPEVEAPKKRGRPKKTESKKVLTPMTQSAILGTEIKEEN